MINLDKLFWNHQLSLIFPPDGKPEETRLYLGKLTINGRNPNRKWWQFWKPKYIQPEEHWTKTTPTPTPVTYTFGVPNNDIFIQSGRDTTITYRTPRGNKETSEND